MSPKSLLRKSDFIPLSVAVTLVTYSRDYIGRLAREGKIVAEQIDREWFVSRDSLLNFYGTSVLEDSVKKRILSQSRKNDLEVKDFYTTKVAHIFARTTKSSLVSICMTMLILGGGLLSGVFVYTQGSALVGSGSQPEWEHIMAALQFLPSQASVASHSRTPAVFSEVVVRETEDNIPMAGGVVLFPPHNTRGQETVEALFSDEVTVVITGTSTGFIRSQGSATELPFVRIPEASI